MIRSGLLIVLLLFASASQAEGIPVALEQLGALQNPVISSAPATVVAINQPNLSAQISASIQEIRVRVGDKVSAGEVLVLLDCRRYDNSLKAAHAGLERIQAQRKLASVQLKRAKELESSRSASAELVDQRAAELQIAAAEIRQQQETIKLLQNDVEDCAIKAPGEAVVTARLAQQGEYVSPGREILSLVQLDALELTARLRGADADELATADKCWFDYLGRHYALQLRRLVPVVDPVTRTQEVRLEFVDATVPAAGAAGRLVWKADAVELPADYLVRRQDALGVFLADGDRARFHALPGAREGRPARVKLSPDTLIVTEGRQRLQDGDLITLPANTP